MFARRLSHLVPLILCSLLSTVSAQEEDAIDRKELDVLLELNHGTEAILAYLEDGDRKIKLTAVDLRFMEKRKVDPKLIAWLRARLPKEKDSLTVEDIISAWKSNQDEAALLKKIAGSDSPTTLTVAQTIALTRARVPKSVLKALRPAAAPAKVTRSVEKPLNLDAIILMANEGKTDAEIIAAINKSSASFDIDPDRITQLKSEGLSDDVIGVLYKRRKKATSRKTPEAQMSTPEVASETESEGFELEMFRDNGLGISMMKPAAFVTTKEFQSVKALVQMVAPIQDPKMELPDLELSVMVVHPRNKSAAALQNANLEPVAASFTKGLKAQFARDGIDVITGKPTYTWIASKRALRIKTQAQVKKTRRGYEGASILLYDEGRIIVLSYSMLLEKAHQWRSILEDCIGSVVLASSSKKTQEKPAAGTRREIAQHLFENWRMSIRRLDFETYRRLHYGLDDSVRSRTTFVNLANGINEQGNRVEIGGIDFSTNTITYNVFSVDGMTPFKLGFTGDGDRFILTGAPVQ